MGADDVSVDDTAYNTHADGSLVFGSFGRSEFIIDDYHTSTGTTIEHRGTSSASE